MVPEEPKESSPENRKRSTPKQPQNGAGKDGSIFSPRFRSVAAMAGWDEDALLNASLVVEDTPERDAKQKRRSRSDLQFKTPPTNSRRKRRVQRKSPVSITVTVLNLDEDDCEREGKLKSINEKLKINEEAVGEKIGKGELEAAASCSSSAIPCMDKLREELSCAICLEICFEPSTTPCGHSFCKKCLRSAADKCGKRCPKCRQLISNGRSCTVNTVLWNTIQLLFPQEVEARKAVAQSRSPPVRGNRNRNIQALNSPEEEGLNLERRRSNHNSRDRIVRPSVTLGRVVNDNFSRRRTRGDMPSQDEDAALALRLQREEFMGAFRGPQEQQQQHDGRRSSVMLASANLRRPGEQEQQQQLRHRRTSVTLATENLRAMASRAINIRLRGRAT